MSTVQDVLNVVQFRIDSSVDLFPLLNNAIKTISQRLYSLDSNLVKDEMDVEAWAEITLTASTISFATGTLPATDTILDSTTGFVTAGFVPGMIVWTNGASGRSSRERRTRF